MNMAQLLLKAGTCLTGLISLCLISSAALAVQITPQPFTFDPEGAPLRVSGLEPFTAISIGFTYSGTVVPGASPGTFEIQSGRVDFTEFKPPTPVEKLDALRTGLNRDGVPGYDLSGMIEASGVAKKNAAGGTDLTFQTFDLVLTVNVHTPVDGDRRTFFAAVLDNPGLTSSNLDVLLKFHPDPLAAFGAAGSDGGVLKRGEFGGPDEVIRELIRINLDGDISSFELGNFFEDENGTISGAGNLSLGAVPEPTTLLLFGTTAAGLGLARWRQRRRGKQQP